MDIQSSCPLSRATSPPVSCSLPHHDFAVPIREGQHAKDLEFKVQGSKATQIKAEEQASARHFRGTPHAALSPVSLILCLTLAQAPTDLHSSLTSSDIENHEGGSGARDAEFRGSGNSQEAARGDAIKDAMVQGYDDDDDGDSDDDDDDGDGDGDPSMSYFVRAMTEMLNTL